MVGAITLGCVATADCAAVALVDTNPRYAPGSYAPGKVGLHVANRQQVATRQQARRPVEERREQLLDAAIAILVAEGFSALTTRRVTQQAGVALGAFHYVFRDKSEMLRAMIGRMADQAQQVLVNAIDRRDTDVLSISEALVRAYWDHAVATPDTHLAQHELMIHALRDPSLAHLANHQHQRSTEAVLAVFDRLPEVVNPAIRNDLATYLVATMDGLVLHHVVHADEAAAARRLNLFVATLPAVVAAATAPDRPDGSPPPD